MSEIIIGFTDGEEISYVGNDALLVHDALDVAAKRGAEWTMPIMLSNDFTVVFVLANITRIAFKKGESK